MAQAFPLLIDHTYTFNHFWNKFQECNRKLFLGPSINWGVKASVSLLPCFWMSPPFEITLTLQRVHFLAHRNRSDFCDLRLRCPSRTPEITRFPTRERAMLHCDLRVRWKVASDLRFQAAISEPKTPSFCGISGDLAQSTRKSLAIAIVRFWCAKVHLHS